MIKKQQKPTWSFSRVFVALVLVLLIGGLIALLVRQRQGILTYDEQRRELRLKNLAELNAENQKILTQYHWVDKNKGIVGLPIERAMQLVLSDLQASRPHPAGPINTPAPAPASTPVSQGTQPAGTPEKPSASPGGQPPQTQ